ncbi:MAG: hypothetical protein IK048_01065 [Clostridia bacterium]|nr:hypothetical protein [Clostridia bacterium]
MTKTAKNVVKLLTIAAILVVVTCLLLVGCNKVEELKDLGKPEAEEGTKSITVYVQNGNGYTKIETSTTEEYLEAVLLKLLQDQQLSECTISGGFISSINNMPGDTPRAYIAVFHDLEEGEGETLVDRGDYAPADIEYDGKTFAYSAVGVSSLPVRDGAGYLFKVETY